MIHERKIFFTTSVKLDIETIIKITNGTLVTNDIKKDMKFTNVASLLEATSSDVSFFNNSKYLQSLQSTNVGLCFVTEKYQNSCPPQTIAIVVKDPYMAFALISQQFYPQQKTIAHISDKSSISKSAKIGTNCHIGDFVFIGENVEIGDDCHIGPNTTIYDNVIIGKNSHIKSSVSLQYCIIGDNCIIHDGVRIGQDGFGFAPNVGGHIKIPQIGGVIIKNNIEIGANSTIDRGALNNTTIDEGTKIDNCVQVAHNVSIGKHCFLAAHVGIAGSTIIEDYVSIGGNSGIAPHLHIKQGAQIAPMSGVANDVNSNDVVIGIPAIAFRSFWKLQALFKRMLEKNKFNRYIKLEKVMNTTLDIIGIKKLLPHRYPFLLVDRVINFVPNESIEAIKNVTANEEFFNGHFPNYPIMPGVLIVEALAQTSALYYLLNHNLTENDKNVFFMGIDNCKFRKPVLPGDTLTLKVSPLQQKGKVTKVEAKAYVNNTLVCEAVLTAMVE